MNNKDEIKDTKENEKKDETQIKVTGEKKETNNKKEVKKIKESEVKQKDIHEESKTKAKDKFDEQETEIDIKEDKEKATDLIKTEDIEIDEKKLKKINEEIKENKKKSRNNEIKNEKHVRILTNIIIAVVGIAYISISLLGSKRIPEEQYLIDLKVFILLGVISAIILFEKAFKTDKFKFALVGIELLVLSAATVMLLHLYKLQNPNILTYSKYFIGIWSIYYIIKSIVIAVKRTDINKKEVESN